MDQERNIYIQFIKYSARFAREKPYQMVRIRDVPNDEQTNAEYEPCDTRSLLRDIRGEERMSSLEEDCICLLKPVSSVEVSNEQEMMVPYSMEINSLLRQHFNKQHAITYDFRVSDYLS